MWNLKYGINELIYKTETDSQTWRTDLWLTGGRGGGRKDWEFGISRCKRLSIGWINNKVLVYGTRNYIQYPVINHSGKEYFLKMSLCVELSHFAVQQRLAQHCKSTLLQFKK